MFNPKNRKRKKGYLSHAREYPGSQGFWGLLLPTRGGRDVKHPIIDPSLPDTTKPSPRQSPMTEQGISYAKAREKRKGGYGAWKGRNFQRIANKAPTLLRLNNKKE